MCRYSTDRVKLLASVTTHILISFKCGVSTAGGMAPFLSDNDNGGQQTYAGYSECERIIIW